MHDVRKILVASLRFQDVMRVQNWNQYYYSSQILKIKFLTLNIVVLPRTNVTKPMRWPEMGVHIYFDALVRLGLSVRKKIEEIWKRDDMVFTKLN